MKTILTSLINHQFLSKTQAKQVLVNIASGLYTPAQISAFLTVYMMRNITLEELDGFREALLELCIPIDLSEYNPIDLCGTGGDGKDTFNISTLAAFVTAATGINVAKHGNYGVSSVCGSSNVLEALGISFTNNPELLKKAIEKAGICILHASLFHPAMKNVAPIRKQLAVKTFFNLLGPMVNPASPKNQVIGVFNLETARMYGYLYQNTDKKFTILHALDGYDEISLTGNAKIISNTTETMLTPAHFGVSKTTTSAIVGGRTIKESAHIFLNILQGKGTEAQNNVVCANAAIAISTAKNTPLKHSFNKAKTALLSGKALQTFDALKKCNP